MLLVLFFYCLLLAVIPGAFSVEINPLHGQHLRIVPFEVFNTTVKYFLYGWIIISEYISIRWQFPVSFIVQRNSTGHIIHSDGVQKHMIETLSQILNFRWVKTKNDISGADNKPMSRYIELAIVYEMFTILVLAVNAFTHLIWSF